MPVLKLGYLLTFKISIFIFYLISLLLLLIFQTKIPKNRKVLQPIDLIIVYLSTFSLIINSQGLGYTDIYFFPFLIVTLLFLSREKWYLGGLFFGLSFLIKWQPIIIAPLILGYLIKLDSKKTIVRVLKLVMGAITAILTLYPLNKNIFQSLSLSFFSGATSDPILSNALNLQWINTFLYHLLFPKIFSPLIEARIEFIDLLSGNIPTFIYFLPKLAFAAVGILIFVRYLTFRESKKFMFQTFLNTSLLFYLSYFMISSVVHENHLFVALILSLIIFIVTPSARNRIILLSVDFMNFINMFVFYGITGKPIISRVLLGTDITLIFSLAFFTVYLILLVSYFSGSFLATTIREEPIGKLM